MAEKTTQRHEAGTIINSSTTPAPQTAMPSPFDRLSDEMLATIGEMIRDQDTGTDTLSLAATSKRLRNAISGAAARIYMMEIKKTNFENEMEYAILIAGGKIDQIRHLVLRSRDSSNIKIEGQRLIDRLTLTCSGLKTITFWPSLPDRPVTSFLPAYNPASRDIEDLGRALQQLRWGYWKPAKRWGEEGLPITFKILDSPDSPTDSKVATPSVPSMNFGLHDVKFVPKGYFSPPGFYPTQNIQQVATAISMSPNETGKKIHIVNFVNWSKEGRDCTADLVQRILPFANFSLHIEILVEAGDVQPTLQAGQQFARSLAAAYLKARNTARGQSASVSVRVSGQRAIHGSSLYITVNAGGPHVARAQIDFRSCGERVGSIGYMK
ncbi:hypothetical protein NliqN6_5869 [Naganishia liquefaciens]|uniref:Uncharacterized protein n=1 Tax=Naganishia liquefaciens TaxID=104408 RepID=A0A8H3TYI9_9TREE|nr:hypothetical protein NliqN6_5869 [Naganishia liquefaciens]